MHTQTGDEDNRKSGHRGQVMNSGSSSESILTKEQLCDMFQNILGVKKHDHQTLCTAMQVDDDDDDDDGGGGGGGGGDDDDDDNDDDAMMSAVLITVMHIVPLPSQLIHNS